MNLIPTLVGIALLALTIGGGISHLSPGSHVAAESAATIGAGFQSLTQAYQTRQMTGAPPPDAANWEATLFPAYGFEPKPPEGTAWSYGSSAAGRWFCLSAAKATEALRGVLVTVGKRYAAASYQVSAKCGDPATTDTGGDTLAATLWVSREGR